MNWYIKCFKHYADFSGRASRREYWMFVWFNFIISFILGFLDGLAGWEVSGDMNLGILSLVYMLIALLPSLSVAVRRLHDIDKSGWSYLLGLIPIIGWILLIVYFCKAGTDGPNTYGPQPQDIYN